MARNDAQQPVPASRVMAFEAFKAGRYMEAESHARKLVDGSPDSDFAWKLLGAVLLHQHRTVEALVALQHANALTPADSEVAAYLGATWLQIGDLERARTELERSARLCPEHWEAHHNLGVVLSELGRLDEARQAFERARVFNPEIAGASANFPNSSQQARAL